MESVLELSDRAGMRTGRNRPWPTCIGWPSRLPRTNARSPFLEVKRGKLPNHRVTHGCW